MPTVRKHPNHMAVVPLNKNGNRIGGYRPNSGRKPGSRTLNDEELRDHAAGYMLRINDMLAKKAGVFFAPRLDKKTNKFVMEQKRDQETGELLVTEDGEPDMQVRQYQHPPSKNESIQMDAGKMLQERAAGKVPNILANDPTNPLPGILPNGHIIFGPPPPMNDDEEASQQDDEDDVRQAG